MENETIKAALVTFGLKENACLADIRAAYLAKTSEARFQQVILGDETLEKDFTAYYKNYMTLLKHYSESTSTDLNDFPLEQIMKFNFNQGLFHLITQNYLKAMEKFQEAHRLNKNDVLVLLYMGILLMKRKNHYAAEKYFQDAVAIDQQCEDAWFYLGENYSKAGEYRKALLMFESVKRLNPSRKGLVFKINEIKEKIPQLASDGRIQKERKKASVFSRIFKRNE